MNGMYRPILMAFAIVSAASPQGRANAGIPARNCGIVPVDSGRIDVKINERKIALLGWSHPDPFPQALQYINQQLTASYDAVSAGDCEGAAIPFRNILVRSYPDLKSSLSARDRLEAAAKEIHAVALGTEFSPVGLRARLEQSKKLRSDLAFIKQACPETSSAIDTFLLIYPGPDLDFPAAQAPEFSIVAADDAELKAQAQALVDGMASVPALEIKNLAPEAARLFEKARSENENDDSQWQIDLDASYSAQPDGSVKALFKKWLDFDRNLWGLDGPRNAAAAHALFAVKGNAMALFGRSHLVGIANKLMDLCQAQP
jgi:hypothetical protein